MDSQLVKEQINALLETIAEQNERIKNNEGKIAQIDLDVMLNTTRNLYESLHYLNKMNNAEIVIETSPIKEKKVIEIKETTVEYQQPKEQHSEMVIPELKKEEPIIISEPQQEEVTAKMVEPKITEQRVNEISKNSKPNTRNGNLFEEVVVMADKFEEQTTVHDKFSRTKEDRSINEKIQNQPLQDLKKSIGINEKFKFMNELFDGNLKEYNESIDILNNFKTFEEAENFMEQNLSAKYNWKKESGVYQSLFFLIQRKFNF